MTNRQLWEPLYQQHLMIPNSSWSFASWCAIFTNVQEGNMLKQHLIFLINWRCYCFVDVGKVICGLKVILIHQLPPLENFCYFCSEKTPISLDSAISSIVSDNSEPKGLVLEVKYIGQSLACKPFVVRAINMRSRLLIFMFSSS